MTLRVNFISPQQDSFQGYSTLFNHPPAPSNRTAATPLTRPSSFFSSSSLEPFFRAIPPCSMKVVPLAAKTLELGRQPLDFGLFPRDSLLVFTARCEH